MCQERGLGKEEVSLERTQPRNELLIFDKELKKSAISMGVGVFDEGVKPVKLCVRHYPR